MAEDQGIDRSELLALTAEIVAAHVGNSAVAGTEVGALIQSVFDTLRGLGSDEPKTTVELTPAVPIKRSVTDDHIVCLEDGKKLKMLKRHLVTDHGLTPEAYRAKWGLRPDYPMATPNYSAQRQKLAKQIGLGRKPRRRRPSRGETEASAQDRSLIASPAFTKSIGRACANRAPTAIIVRVGGVEMLSRLWWFVRAHVETFRQYRSAVVTAEALIWHHGYKGLDAALKAAETPTGDLLADVRAELVAKLAADRYLCFKQADLVQRAAMLDLWGRRRGQMDRLNEASLPEVVPASA